MVARRAGGERGWRRSLGATPRTSANEIDAVCPTYRGIKNLRKKGDQFQYGGPRLLVDTFPTPTDWAISPWSTSPKSARPRACLSWRRGAGNSSTAWSTAIRSDHGRQARRDPHLREDAARLGIARRRSHLLRNELGRVSGRAKIDRIAAGNLQGSLARSQHPRPRRLPRCKRRAALQRLRGSAAGRRRFTPAAGPEPAPSRGRPAAVGFPQIGGLLTLKNGSSRIDRKLDRSASRKRREHRACSARASPAGSAQFRFDARGHRAKAGCSRPPDEATAIVVPCKRPVEPAQRSSGKNGVSHAKLTIAGASPIPFAQPCHGARHSGKRTCARFAWDPGRSATPSAANRVEACVGRNDQRTWLARAPAPARVRSAARPPSVEPGFVGAHPAASSAGQHHAGMHGMIDSTPSRPGSSVEVRIAAFEDGTLERTLRSGGRRGAAGDPAAGRAREAHDRDHDADAGQRFRIGRRFSAQRRRRARRSATSGASRSVSTQISRPAQQYNVVNVDLAARGAAQS